MTHDERRDAGRALRETVPRSAHAEWSVAGRTRDAVAVLEEQGRARVPEFRPVRDGRAESPFAFFRGGAAIMAMDLSTTPVTGLTVQACGDAHVANFGTFATPERNVIFDINDFDETDPGPWEWDVKRLAASLHVVARQHGFAPDDRDDVVLEAVRVYREYVAQYAAMMTLEVWYARTTVDDVVAHFPRRYRAQAERDVKRALRKDRVRAVAKLTHTVDGRAAFLENPPLTVHLDATGHDMEEVEEMVSVGTRCWICLFEAPRSGAGDDRIILQVKEAPASVLAPYVGAAEIGHEGRRVVAGQRLTQAAGDIFLGWCEAPRSGRQYYVRQLWDVKGQGDLTRMDLGKLTHYGALCAQALARAHARTGDAAAALSGYLGKGRTFDRAVARFAADHAANNERDHAALLEAVAAGRVTSQTF